MNVKEAVKRAKDYVSDLMAEEGLANLGLEEVERDDSNGEWRVTVGFSRPWNSERSALTALAGEAPPKRAYRVVRLRDADGEVLSLERRDPDPSEP